MLFWKVFSIIFAFQVPNLAKSSMVTLNNGGYENIVIAINPAINEDLNIIETIKDMINEGSNYLFHATKQRLFVRSVKILIPSTWSSKMNYTKPKTETYDKADIIIASPLMKYRDDPYTLQYGGCGEPGKYIHLTPDFLLDDRLTKVYGPRGRVFVHEWAHLRWGVYDEYNNEAPFYISGSGKVEATRCSLDITGTNRKQQCDGADCILQPCLHDSSTGLYEDGCVFIPEKNQFVKESIMYMQALPSVSEFCNSSNHNTEAPTLQNRICNSRSTWDVINKSPDIISTPPKTDFSIPVPTVSLLHYQGRVVTLVLDVSGSMASYDRIGRLYQAADLFLNQIIEPGSYVGLVKFSSDAFVISNLLQIISEVERLKLASLLPNSASGGTNICAGIKMGLQVNKGFDGSSYGTEILLLTDGEDNYDTRLCFPDIKESGSIIHVIALGPNAASALEEIANMTGGLQFSATDNLSTNGLIDSFNGISAGNGNISQQAIQLESTALNLSPKECLNGTVFIDNSVGNKTFFLVTWQSSVPTIKLKDPTGKQYTAAHFISDTISKSSRLEIPGTAEKGPWEYSLCNSFTAKEVIGITVNSKAVDENVAPVTVSAQMNKDINMFPNPMVVYATVSQGYLPIKGAKVTAIVEPQIGSPVTKELLDNGAGADIIKNDGIYSRYFTEFKGNGRYSLKVRVEGRENKSDLALSKSRAYYIPGYVENGEISMNPSRPQVNDDNSQLYLGPFSRTASGGSFIVSNVPSGPLPDIYKPERITDLKARIQNQMIALTWTATGDDLDQGNASRYDLRMSTSPKDLRDNFENCTSVNISDITPQPSGSSETFTFVPENVVIANGTILYFALIAFDEVSQKSDLSNIAQAALLIPATPEPTTKPPTTPYYTTDPLTTQYDTTTPPPSSYNTTTPPPTSYNTTTPPPTSYNTTTPPPTSYNTTTPPPTSYNTTTPPPSSYNTTTQPPTSYNTTTPPPTIYNTTTPPPTSCNTTTPPPTSYNTTTPPPTSYNTSTPPHSSYNTTTPPPTSYNTSTPPHTSYNTTTPPPTSYNTSTPPHTSYDTTTLPTTLYDTTSLTPTSYDPATLPTTTNQTTTLPIKITSPKPTLTTNTSSERICTTSVLLLIRIMLNFLFQ
ncbi:calcium-activated chloride channel regulator 1-like [Bombina bombina]|uniref:calcium-activated chloride channel regulator 1-like n=1 Tax=Bombina bombina TaxID=8345 RepID=UPI00235A6DB1|nr:calcium-activated chloride channel regulator 1-like [Bombina bombina]